MTNQPPEWAFENSRGRQITTRDAVTAEKYRQDARFTEVTRTDAAGEPDPVPYARQRKSDLEAEVARRNVGRNEADLIPDTGTRDELAAALDADDARAAS